MKSGRFDPSASLIVVKGTVWGSQGAPKRVRLVLDTGASVTTLQPDILDHLGYSPRDGEAPTRVRSAVAEELGYFIRVARFMALGHHCADFRVNAHDLPEGYNIDGLLGLNFLRQLNYEVRSAEGRIIASRVGLTTHT